MIEFNGVQGPVYLFLTHGREKKETPKFRFQYQSPPHPLRLLLAPYLLKEQKDEKSLFSFSFFQNKRSIRNNEWTAENRSILIGPLPLIKKENSLAPIAGCPLIWAAPSMMQSNQWTLSTRCEKRRKRIKWSPKKKLFNKYRKEQTGEAKWKWLWATIPFNIRSIQNPPNFQSINNGLVGRGY